MQSCEISQVAHAFCRHCLLLTTYRNVPYPFVRASQQSCSIIVKPTQGDFLNNYQLMDDLHIGVISSRGTVVSYDWNGIIEDTENWQECLVVFQLNDHFMEKHWDTVLTNIVKNECWNSSSIVKAMKTKWKANFIKILDSTSKIGTMLLFHNAVKLLFNKVSLGTKKTIVL
ncbi:hypothetical protein AGLY_014220 [Aphis glycines]|uniref:MKRN2 opposite strand protein-like C-terminal domain-containing protein n=1 Tax=Aphis glycines TaxID=307491 RepID=A0A6G0T4U2_APHGL|nr:hypothetical protein AGLY_014220 [Aphis glycines]